MDREAVAITAGRMVKARAVLVRDYPFFGYLSLGLRLVCAPCGTACTDGERLIFDPAFAGKLTTEKELRFVILHEVLHCALEHCTRGKSLNAMVYNIACDIVVNSMIFGMWGLDTFQVAGEEPMHLAPDGREGREYNAEEVYRMLLSSPDRQKEPDEGQMPDFDGKQTLDRHDIWKSIREERRMRDTWNRRIEEAARMCQDTKGRTQVERRLTEDLKKRSTVDWKQVLHDFLQFDAFDYTFLPPDRRFSDGDYFVPSFAASQESSVNEIWICMDTSASISSEQLSAAMGEVQDAMRQVGLTGSLSFFDTSITDPVPFSSEDAFRAIVPKGGGGTSFHPIFSYLKERLYPNLPRAILVFTDGFAADWPEEDAALEVPVLWLIGEDGNTKAPWGRVVRIATEKGGPAAGMQGIEQVD